MAGASEGPHIPAVLVKVRLPRRLRLRATRRVRVHRLRRDLLLVPYLEYDTLIYKNLLDCLP